ncbi:MAG: pantetheine-phosphate adenylyltransferase [Oscillospiraceae bacterium]|nr:pantetheine-phosphate adenylyltransferase [Oscillospiraceae bacterium]
MKTLAVCPGSFDPVTEGHLDIIRRAAQLFDRVIVLAMTNAEKRYMFSMEERLKMLRLSTAEFPNVETDSYQGLLADYVRTRGASAIIKGLRAMSDFEYEFQMALTNRKLNPAAETVFLTTTAELMYMSSSLVRQVAALGGDISGFVPACIIPIIEKKLQITGGNP